MRQLPIAEPLLNRESPLLCWQIAETSLQLINKVLLYLPGNEIAL